MLPNFVPCCHQEKIAILVCIGVHTGLTNEKGLIHAEISGVSFGRRSFFDDFVPNVSDRVFSAIIIGTEIVTSQRHVCFWVSEMRRRLLSRTAFESLY